MRLYKLSPAVKDYIWGGTNLKKEWNKVSDADRVAETWELSFHPDGPSRIAAGPEEGRLLREVVSREEYGTNCQKFPFFPTLVKFIDAADNLSVQVHPSAEYALSEEGQFGKTEMWYVCGREPGAGIYCGFEREISPEEYAARIAEGRLTEVLKLFAVEPGECYFIPAGTVHAIGKGTTICEIQQNSNLTYRVYDFGRVGKDGKPRELHVEKAERVSVLAPYVPAGGARKISERIRLLASCPYFTVYEVKTLEEDGFDTDASSFTSFSVIEGSGEAGTGGSFLPFRKGDTFFATAGEGRVSLRGRATLLLTRVE